MVQRWQTPYLGARFLPKQLSGWEIDHFFTLAPGRRRILVNRLKQQARTAGDVPDLIEFARRWLYKHQIIIPSINRCVSTRDEYSSMSRYIYDIAA